MDKRHCPKAEVGHCVNCRPTCAITTGFSGAGAFSDGKLSLSYEVGGDLPTLIGEEFAQELIDYTDKIYLEFGADPHVEGIYTGEDLNGDGVVAPEVAHADVEATAVELDDVDESATVEQENDE